MPTYEYLCDGCSRTYDVRQRISEPPLTQCQFCGGPIRRLLSPAPFILKGAGFYVNDYPSEARKKAMSEEKPTAGNATGSSAGSSDSPGSSSATPAPAKA